MRVLLTLRHLNFAESHRSGILVGRGNEESGWVAHRSAATSQGLRGRRDHDLERQIAWVVAGTSS
jgi:hypothetical protein